MKNNKCYPIIGAHKKTGGEFMKYKIFLFVNIIIIAVFVTSLTSKQHRSGHKMKCMGQCKCCNMKDLDANKDGKISKKEWSEFHNSKFSKIDKNNDGNVDKNEMQAHHKTMKKGCPRKNK